MTPTAGATIKRSEPVRIAEAVATAPGVGTEHVGPVFTALLQELIAQLEAAGVRPGMTIARYEPRAADGSLRMHVGLDISQQELTDSDRVRVVELPAVEVASAVHRGAMDGLAEAWSGLFAWAEQGGYAVVGGSRELYHRWDYEDPAGHLTEIQVEVTSSRGSELPRRGASEPSPAGIGSSP